MDSLIYIGLDEAGRGPWAGPVFCSAVILPKNIRISGINDSKLLTEKKREKLFDQIIKKVPYGIGSASNTEIDNLGLIRATELGFQRALNDILFKIDTRNVFLEIDGRDKFYFDFPYRSIIRGDQKIKSIGAASILAKVSRDRFMCEMAIQYPRYRFDKHKGYGTKLHMQMLQEYGPCEIHRKSFKPVFSMSFPRRRESMSD